MKAPKPYNPPKPPSIWDANWIWHPKTDNPNNFHALFRRQFDIKNSHEARIWVTASAIYDLYINGRKVGRGPSPSFPKFTYFDCYDVEEFLQPGQNVIAVHCYCFGPDMKSALTQHESPGGFLLQLEADGAIVLETDDSWRVTQDPAFVQDTAQITGHLGWFKEIFDAGKELVGWSEPDFNDGGWKLADVIGPVGTAPWETLLPREIPLIKTEIVLPQDAFYHTTGNAYGSPKYDVSSPEALTRDDDSLTVVHPLSPDFSPTIYVDFGKGVYGYFEIRIEGGAEGCIDISYGESLNLTVVDTIIMRSGKQTYRTFNRRGGRFVALTFRNLAEPVAISRVICHARNYPVKPVGEFVCSDEMLNRIWNVGRYTVQTCLQDHYEDCPWREQSLYPGDIAVGAILSYYAFGTQDIARKSLRQMAKVQRDNGEIPCVGPAPTVVPCIPEYPAFWLICLSDYYRHWGDKALVAELAQNVKKCLSWYSSLTGSDSMWRPAEGQEIYRFVDNLSGVGGTEPAAAEQIIIARAFSESAWLMDAIGDAKAAGEYRSISREMLSSVNNLFWDDDKKLLADTLASGARTFSQITNGLALLYDGVSEDRKRFVAEALLDRTKCPPIRAAYMNHYMVEALVASGKPQAAMERIREYWGGMVERGATTFWETFDPGSRHGSIPERLWSLCHEFCSSPVFSLPAHVAGIKAIEPGFARFEVAPKPCGMDWLRSSVPTPAGIVTVICMSNPTSGCVDIDVTVPAGLVCETVVPLPGRDLWTVSVDGAPVRPDADVSEYAGSGLPIQAAKTEADGLRIVFNSADVQSRYRLSTSTKRVFAPGALIIAAPWGEWGSTPPVE